MSANHTAWVMLRSIRSMAKNGAAAVADQSRVFARNAARSESAAHTMCFYLRRVYYENAVAGRHDVAVALADAAAEICRARGEPFERKLADALYRAADSRHRTGSPALAHVEECVAILERHLEVAGAPYAQALALLAEVHHAEGRTDAAVDAARRALDLERRFGSANVPAAELRLARVAA